MRSKLRQSPVDFGYCTATVSCHNDTVEHYARRLLRHSGYTGIVGIEFKLDPKTGEYKLIEINTRPVNTTGISIGCGVNLPLIAFRDALGIKQAPVSRWEDGVIWIRFAQDLGAALELRRRGRLTFSEWIRSIRGKRVHALLAFDDLRPFFGFYRRYTARQLKMFKLRVQTSDDGTTTRGWLKRVTTWIL